MALGGDPEFGLLVLGGSSLLTGLAPNVGLLIAARMVQGVGGALVTAAALPLVLSDLPAARRRFAIGIWGSAGCVAVVRGPTLGAAVADATSWRFTVALISPIAVITYLFGRPTPLNMAIATAWPVTASLMLDPVGALAIIIGAALGALSITVLAARYLGGHTGDVFGAAIMTSFAGGLLGANLAL